MTRLRRAGWFAVPLVAAVMLSGVPLWVHVALHGVVRLGLRLGWSEDLMAACYVSLIPLPYLALLFLGGSAAIRCVVSPKTKAVDR